MAKKVKSRSEALSEVEQMTAKVTAILARRLAIATQKSELDTWEDDLQKWMVKEKRLSFGGLIRTETITAPKWSGLKGKPLTNAKKRLMAEPSVARFIKFSIDVESLFNALTVGDKTLLGTLTSHKIMLVEGAKSWALKAEK
jgi:hypothetical protein